MCVKTYCYVRYKKCLVRSFLGNSRFDTPSQRKLFIILYIQCKHTITLSFTVLCYSTIFSFTRLGLDYKGSSRLKNLLDTSYT